MRDYIEIIQGAFNKRNPETRYAGPGVYAIGCMNTRATYIGSGVVVRNRFNAHWNMLRAGRHFNRNLQHIWNLHREDGLSFRILSRTDTADEAYADELVFIKTHDGVVMNSAGGAQLGREEAKKIRNAAASLHKIIPQWSCAKSAHSWTPMGRYGVQCQICGTVRMRGLPRADPL